MYEDLRTFETLEVIAIREIRETKPLKQKLEKIFLSFKKSRELEAKTDDRRRSDKNFLTRRLELLLR